MKPRLDSKKWAIATECLNCGWERKENEEWGISDVFKPPSKCPNCEGKLTIKRMKCPSCGELRPKWRFPKTIRMALWGGDYCSKCDVEFDKWENIIKSNQSH